MSTPAKLVKALRDKTGAGMMLCKEALASCDNDIDKAVVYLRKKGVQAAAKRSSRTTKEGRVGSYIHMGGKIGVLVEIGCETDFVAKTDEFNALVKDVAMHIAASNPGFLNRDAITEQIIEQEKEILREQAIKSGKPEHIVDKIVEGKLSKFYEENCLLNQPFVKDPDKTVDDVVKDVIAKMGENIAIKRFSRFQLGE